MERKWRIILLFIILLVIYIYGSINSHKNLIQGMYKAKTAKQVTLHNEIKPKKEAGEPLIINLSKKELEYHSLTAAMLINRCEKLVEKMKMVEKREDYARVLYKIEAIIELEAGSDEIFREVIYYIYVFVDNTIPKKSIDQWMYAVCIWEKDKVILNSGFTKDCEIDNNWLYWEKENCPNVLYLEHELKKAFDFEQIEKKQKKDRKRKEGPRPLFYFSIYLFKKCFTASKTEEVWRSCVSMLPSMHSDISFCISFGLISPDIIFWL